MPTWLLFLLMSSGLGAAFVGAAVVAAGLVGPVPGGASVLLGLLVAFTGARWAWTGEGPRRGPGDDQVSAAG